MANNSNLNYTRLLVDKCNDVISVAAFSLHYFEYYEHSKHCLKKCVREMYCLLLAE